MRNKILLNPSLGQCICLTSLLGWASVAWAQAPESVSEKDFLGDMPIVLSVSRLPQRLDETPGAVTVLDREMIRLSGARDVADLMRLVPGFRVSNSFEAGAPQVSYHNNLTAFSNSNQLLVDGRSVYSPFFLGQTSTGLQTVAIEDIERIEVLRGSNSAAYGARAFLGTINIVTRDPVETLGLQAHVASGDNSINDARASIGWAAEAGNFRLGVDRRADAGLSGSSGPDTVSRINFRGDVRLGAGSQLEVRAGQTAINAGVGFAGNIGNNVRDRLTEMSFVQMDWHRSFSENEDIALSFSHTTESTRDTFPVDTANLFPLFSGIVAFDIGGKASSDQLSFQHTVRQNNNLRAVWGAELRQERVTSKALYDTDADFVTDFSRLFGNVEWRIHPSLLLNVGGLFEKSSINGNSFMPRVMFNWHAAEGQTLRWGVSEGQRPPSTYEKFSNTRYYFNIGGAPGVAVYSASRGGVQAEKVLSREIGYLGDFPGLGMNLDVRLFHEAVRDSIKFVGYPHPDAWFTGGQAIDFANVENFDIHGIEYQLKWRPWRGGQVILNQSLVDSGWTDNGNTTYKPQPYLSSGLMLTQKLPGGVDLSVMYSQTDTTNFPGAAPMMPAMSRTDVRVGWPLRFGRQRGEVSFVVQNLGPANPDFQEAFYFRKQAFVMLKLEN
ncbi:MAG: TonB-dependent receptor [Pseudomonadota bacterium]